MKKLIQTALLIVSLNAVIVFAEEPQAEKLSQAELEQILAPIALYPDTVLSHILIAATYPLEVIQAERWTANNPDMQGSEAVEAVSEMDWDPSVRALVAFPQILKRLSEDLEWTQRLGDAFLQDEEGLVASVQTLRQRAYDAGSLDDLEKVSVTHEDESIIIAPREREVIYLPYYDTRTIYGPWSWANYPPTYWDNPYYDHYYVSRHHRPFYWGPRVSINYGFFFSSFHWSDHYIVRIPYNHYRPRHYYNHRQIVRHNNARRWGHDPFHRRGVVYQNINVSNRYHHGNRAHLGNRSNPRVNRNVLSVPARSPRVVNAPQNSARTEHRSERLGHDTRAYRGNNNYQNRTTNSDRSRPAEQARPNRSDAVRTQSRPTARPNVARPNVARPNVVRPAPANTQRAVTTGRSQPAQARQAPPAVQAAPAPQPYKKPAAQRQQAKDDDRESTPKPARTNRRVQPR